MRMVQTVHTMVQDPTEAGEPTGKGKLNDQLPNPLTGRQPMRHRQNFLQAVQHPHYHGLGGDVRPAVDQTNAVHSEKAVEGQHLLDEAMTQHANIPSQREPGA